MISTDQLIAGDRQVINPTWNQALLPYGFYSEISRPDYFGYLRENADVIRGNAGTVKIKVDSELGSEKFSNLPNFIGDNRADSVFNDLKFELVGSKSRKYKVKILVSGAAFSGNGQVEICINDSCMPYSNEQKIYKFLIESPQSLYLKTEMDVAYVVLSSLEWQLVVD